MEFDTKSRDYPSFRLMVSSENYMKPGIGDGFSLESCLSKGSIQDFPQFDQFHFDRLPENSKSGDLLPYFDYFETLADRSSSSFDVSEPKSFIEASGKGVMEKFQNWVFMNCPSRIMPDVIEPKRMTSASLNFRDLQSPNLPFLHEEFSCVTANQNRLCIETGMNTKKFRSSTSEVQRKTNMVKGKWTAEEDCLLMDLVTLHGERKWSTIAEMMHGRIGKQCRERWNNHLRPDIKVIFLPFFTFSFIYNFFIRNPFIQQIFFFFFFFFFGLGGIETVNHVRNDVIFVIYFSVNSLESLFSLLVMLK
ncbi:uncharacterized protein LOC122078527 [Macadamia integrifolia]|uniref:uncharacterized protein LOC122078527 n=1 Tax=Macadamia integrifolia TaxID=60698 RepID=UPI001C5001FD|nr:uncharacterized protein LOC122078527 [Macadamia integrifolia]